MPRACPVEVNACCYLAARLLGRSVVAANLSLLGQARAILGSRQSNCNHSKEPSRPDAATELV